MSSLRKENLAGMKLVCNGQHDGKAPHFIPRGIVDDLEELRRLASRQGWTHRRVQFRGGGHVVVDECPRHRS